MANEYTISFRTHEIDPNVLKLFYGDPLSYKVGDKVRHRDFSNRSTSELPGGTVLLFPSGDAHVLSDPGSVFLFRSGMIKDLGTLSKTERIFTILHLPDTTVSERDELAYEIYKSGMLGSTTHPDAANFRDRNAPDFWSFRAADYVLANYRRKVKHPDLLDCDGDLWQWGEAADAYRSPDVSHMEPRSRAAIEDKFGPVTEVARCDSLRSR